MVQISKKNVLLLHVRENPVHYALVIFMLFVGLTAGFFTVGALSDAQSGALDTYFQGLFSAISDTGINILTSVLTAIWNNLKLFVPLLIFGLWIAGIPFVLIVVAIKGFFTGFTMGVLISNLGFSGFLISLLCVLLPNVIIIPCFLRAGVIAMQNGIKRVKKANIPTTSSDRAKSMGPYLRSLLPVTIMVMAGALIEGIVSPLLLRLFV